jgi:dipeptidyl aminopeptidase/acylaminoacyl peptidase
LGRYGTIDADDVLAIARHARRKHDKQAPIHLTGGSYGGFMTNWLLGQTSEFRSGVTQRSISNWVSFYGTSDIGPRFSEREVEGTPWKNTRKLWRQSPLKYVANITTPLLILHAEEDHRCPMEQAEQLFTALKRIGKAPTRMIRIPGENHELSRSGRPDRRVARLEAILGWFREHA